MRKPPTSLGWPAAALLAALSVVLLVACGGGVGSGGTGAPVALGYAQGPISGFGSIIVNGVHYDEADARIVDDDDQTADRAALALGMVVAIDSGAVATDADGSVRAQASQVSIRPALVGPLEAVDAGGGTLQVLGQRVQVGAGTVFADALATGLAGLQPGQWLEVHALFDEASQAWRATRLAPASAGRGRRLRGPVSAVDRAGASVRIGQGSYRFDAGVGLPAAGQVVRLLLDDQGRDAEGRFGVRERRGDDAAPSDRAQVQWRGRVAALAAGPSFTLDGVLVDARSATLRGTLASGVEVSVEGSLQAGVLVARQVTVRGSDAGGPDDDLHGAHVEVRGRVDVVAADARSMTVVDDGGRVTRVGLTRADLVFEGGARGDLVAGRLLRVDGLPAAEGAGIDAVRIRFGA